MNRFSLIAAALAVLAGAPAMAQSSYSTFEGAVPAGSPASPAYVIVPSADGWTGGTNGIELQYGGIGGAPAATGGSVFVELDTTGNSYMERSLTAGLYTLDFLYTPRPNIAVTSNGIEVSLVGGTGSVLGTFNGAGSTGTTWAPYNLGPFSVAAGQTLRFTAIGNSDSLGGYVDNIRITAVPEPATWALMITGFGLAGASMRRRRAGALAIA